MQRYGGWFTLLLLTGSAFGQEIPAGVHYRKAPQAVTDSFVHQLQHMLGSEDPKVVSKGFSDVIMGGPGFWSVCKKVGMSSGKPMTFVIPDTSTGKSQSLPGRRFITTGDKLDAWKSVKALLSLGQKDAVRIRRPKKAEIAYYWAMIPYDIEEPLVVMETKKVSLLVNGGKKGKVFFLEILPRNLTSN